MYAGPDVYVLAGAAGRGEGGLDRNDEKNGDRYRRKGGPKHSAMVINLVNVDLSRRKVTGPRLSLNRAAQDLCAAPQRTPCY